jgi:hypothetical protein
MLLTDFVCLYNYEFLLSLCKIVRSSVILLLPLFTYMRYNNMSLSKHVHPGPDSTKHPCLFWFVILLQIYVQLKPGFNTIITTYIISSNVKLLNTKNDLFLKEHKLKQTRMFCWIRTRMNMFGQRQSIRTWFVDLLIIIQIYNVYFLFFPKKDELSFF